MLSMTAVTEVTTSEEEMIYTDDWGREMAGGYTYTGLVSGLVVPQDGRITRWQFYSIHVGEGAVQVWRPTDDQDQ